MHAVRRGYQVKAVDLEAQCFPWVHPDLELICGDFLELEMLPDTFDFIMNSSSVECVGLTSRYGDWRSTAPTR
jgi:hypothetical protein